MGSLRIEMLGTTFTIEAGNADNEYLQKLLGYYERITDDVAKNGIINPTQIAIIAGINLCDELYKEKEKKIAMENGEYMPVESNPIETTEIERRTQEMIEKINKVL